MVKDKVVLITGGTTGIGLKTAELFASKAAIVYMNYYDNEKKAEESCDNIKKKGYDCNILQGDVSSKEDVESMVETIVNEHGRIDILINNASPSLVLKPFERLDVKELEKDFNVIVKGAFYACQAVIPHMKKQKYGRIVNVLSTSIMNKAPSYMSSYIASKSALSGLTKALASELGSYGITVNSVSPGFTETSLIKEFPHKIFDFYKASLAVKRLANTNDVARAILFLCLSGSDYITGTNIPVCGGGVM